MALKTVDELAHILTDNERQKLLDKIKLSLEPEQSDLPKDSFEKRIENKYAEEIRTEIQQLSFWQRVAFRFKQFFLSKPPEEIFINMKLEDITQSVKKSCSDLVNVDKRMLTTEFAKFFVDFYNRIRLFQSIYGGIWKSPYILPELVHFMVEKRVAHAKSEILDFMPTDELINFFDEQVTEQSIKKKLARKIHTYIQGIPHEAFKAIEEEVLYIHSCKQLALLDASSFFSALRISNHGKDYKWQQEHTVKISFVFPELQDLYNALHALPIRKKIANDFHIDVLNYLHWKGLYPTEASSVKQQPGNFLKSTMATAESFLQQTQLLSIIRIIRINPYYQGIKSRQNVNVLGFYHSSLQLKIFDELDSKFSDFIRGYIRQKKKLLFLSDAKGFAFFKSMVDPEKSGESSFRYVNSLTHLYQFLTCRLMNKYLKPLRKVARSFASLDHELFSGFILNNTYWAGLLEAIKTFDQKFSHVSNEGKEFQRICLNKGLDALQFKLYREFVEKIDNESLLLLKRGSDQLGTLKALLNQAVKRITFNVVNLTDVAKYNKENMEKILQEIDVFQRILLYERQLEDDKIS